MSIIKNAKFHESVCPLCNKDFEGEGILVPIQGTEEGNICEAILVHIECLHKNVVYNRDYKIIYAKV